MPWFGLQRIVLSTAILFGTGSVAAQENRPPIDVDPCSPLMFRVLPGEFNFCLARKQWEKGHYDQGRELFQLAAGWGNKLAQRILGLTYFNGEGGVQDRALGLAWLALAAERQDPTALGLYQSALAKVDHAEKSRAQVLYQQKRLKYADEVAAARADRRFQREIRALASNPVYGSGKCIVGANTGAIDPEAELFSCSLASEQAVIQNLETRSDFYFGGWRGRVIVGPLEKLRDKD